VEDDRLVVRPAGTPRPSLEQRLGAFDPQRHGGEAMSAPRVGAEAM
jgi:antitoxin MazE